MEKINIIYVDDQREVLSTINKDLSVFEEHCRVEECESADEVLELIEEIDEQGDYLAVVISDHIMPGKNGVELLTEIHADERFTDTKKILLTGMATHQDTIRAINQARIDHYFEKPWKSDELVATIKKLLTQYVLDKGIAYRPYMPILDSQLLFDELRHRM